MEDETKQFVKQYTSCQRFKKKKCIKISPNNIELIHLDTVCIDLVGPYIVINQKGYNRILNAMRFVLGQLK